MRITTRLKGNYQDLGTAPDVIARVSDRTTHRLALEAGNMMKEDVAKASSVTANSIQVKKKGDAYYVVGPTVKHAFFLEHGRSPGKMPPKNAIQDWMRVKGIRLPAKEAEQVSFLIARKIAKKGTKPQPFVSPVARKREHWIKRYNTLMDQGLTRELK